MKGLVQCYLPIHDLSIHYFADSRIHIHLNSSQFTEFLYYIHHNDTVNWKEIPNFFNSRFPIHGKFLVPKNVNWKVTLYILFENTTVCWTWEGPMEKKIHQIFTCKCKIFLRSNQGTRSLGSCNMAIL